MSTLSSAEWTAEQGHGLLTSGLFGLFTEAIKQRDVYIDVRLRKGDTDGQIVATLGKWGLGCWVHVADTDEQAVENSRDPQIWLRKLTDGLRTPRDWSKLTPEDAEQVRARVEAADAIKDWEYLRDNVMAIGSPETVLAKFQSMSDAGLGHVIAWMDFGGMDNEKIKRSMTLLKEMVMPNLKPLETAAANRLISARRGAAEKSPAAATRS